MLNINDYGYEETDGIRQQDMGGEIQLLKSVMKTGTVDDQFQSSYAKKLCRDSKLGVDLLRAFPPRDNNLNIEQLNFQGTFWNKEQLIADKERLQKSKAEHSINELQLTQQALDELEQYKDGIEMYVATSGAHMRSILHGEVLALMQEEMNNKTNCDFNTSYNGQQYIVKCVNQELIKRYAEERGIKAASQKLSGNLMKNNQLNPDQCIDYLQNISKEGDAMMPNTQQNLETAEAQSLIKNRYTNTQAHAINNSQEINLNPVKQYQNMPIKQPLIRIDEFKVTDNPGGRTTNPLIVSALYSIKPSGKWGFFADELLAVDRFYQAFSDNYLAKKNNPKDRWSYFRNYGADKIFANVKEKQGSEQCKNSSVSASAVDIKDFVFFTGLMSLISHARGFDNNYTGERTKDTLLEISGCTKDQFEEFCKSDLPVAETNARIIILLIICYLDKNGLKPQNMHQKISMIKPKTTALTTRPAPLKFQKRN